MKFLAGLAALATLAAAAPSGAPTPLDVKLEMTGNTQVKATITNNGKSNLKIFKAGTIFDKAPVEKAKVHDGTKNANFEGIRLRLTDKNLDDSAFQKIAAGKSVEVTFNVAETHDLSRGGKFDIASSGILSYAGESDNKLIGSVPYQSNKISASVNGGAAAAVRNGRKAKRTEIQDDCTGDRLSAVTDALSNCVQLANKAGDVASNGDAAKLEEFFKSSDSSVRSQVADVFSKVAAECGNGGGVSTTHCVDVESACQSGVLAYTSPSESLIVYCDLYFTDLPGLTSSCHAQDQATTNLHETTHLSQVAGTQDLGYGYDNIQQLDTQDSLNNADSYAVFANSIYAGC